MIIYFLPIVDLICSSFSINACPLFTVYGTFWCLLMGHQAWSILPQIIIFKMLNISYFEIIIIILLELTAFYIRQDLYKKSPMFLIFCLIYYLTHIYNYEINLIAFGLLFLITAVMWYTEKRGRLDNRFV
jgi:hypothetical protein